MSRCPRCDACESQWENKPCNRCGYPYEDKRTKPQATYDDRAYQRRLENDMGEYEL